MSRRTAIALAATLVVLWVVAFLLIQKPWRSRLPNVVLITIDTLRADHLGCYGYRRKTSPAIDELSRSSLVYKNAISQAPATLPSLLQLMTGRHAIQSPIPKDVPTLAELLAAAHFQTGAVVDNPLVEVLKTGLDRGFQKFYVNDVLDPRTLQQLYKTKMPADVITRQAIRWLDERDAHRPVFLWLHYFDPHGPYFPPFTQDIAFAREHSRSAWTGDQSELKAVPSEYDRQHIIDLYDAEISYLDTSLKDLFEELARRDLFDDSLLILTADHGESLGEHENLWGHGLSVYDSEIHIPMLVKLPGAVARHEIIEEPVQLIDVFPLVCSVLGLEPRVRMDGRNIVAGGFPYSFLFWNGLTVARGREWKLISSEKFGREQLFQISNDPGELKDRSNEDPAALATLRAARDEWKRSMSDQQDALSQQSQEQLEQLRSLEYLSGGKEPSTTEAPIGAGTAEALSDRDATLARNLIQRLRDVEPDVRNAATDALGALGPNAVPLLIEALGDNQDTVRNGSAIALSSIGAPAIAPLIEALGSPLPHRRNTAVVTLVRIGAPAVPLLIRALGSGDPDRRSSAAVALTQIGMPAVSALEEAAEGPDPTVRQAATGALKSILGPSK